MSELLPGTPLENDPIQWIWADLAEKCGDFGSKCQHDDFVVSYNRYLDEVRDNYDENLDIYDRFYSPIESLNSELSCEGMPGRLEEKYAKLLDSLTTKRAKINEVMTFVVDFSDQYSVQMIELLIQRFPNSAFEVKLSILYCISDILYNSHSSKTGAWKLRNCIMGLFPYLVSHISFHKNRGNSSYTELTTKTKNIIDIWLEWKIFPLEYIRGLCSALNFDQKLEEMKNDPKTRLVSNIDEESPNGVLLDDGIISVLSVWPIKSRSPVWRIWREIRDLLEKKSLHEPKLRQDWIMKYGIIIAPLRLFGLTNFLHRVSNFYTYNSSRMNENDGL
ncbi:RPR domain containing protein [Cryptosporidium canis]|uniref:RPR domain containing protein n=1 Tax=Cryptosporidium canis TaxID=195482 RepID=A0ABQ8PAS7_9CRYT|nr:RPR domain containing protein [Cryptosporidium canis]